MRQPASSVGHMDPSPQEFTPLCGPLSCTRPGLVSVGPTEYGRCDGMILLGLDYKRLWLPSRSLIFPLGSHILGEASCCVKQLRGEAHVVKN